MTSQHSFGQWQQFEECQYQPEHCTSQWARKNKNKVNKKKNTDPVLWFTKSSIQHQPWENWGLDNPTPTSLLTGRVGENLSSENTTVVDCVLAQIQWVMRMGWEDKMLKLLCRLIKAFPPLLNFSVQTFLLTSFIPRPIFLMFQERWWYIRFFSTSHYLELRYFELKDVLNFW